jgi:hypothetical protein
MNALHNDNKSNPIIIHLFTLRLHTIALLSYILFLLQINRLYGQFNVKGNSVHLGQGEGVQEPSGEHGY